MLGKYLIQAASGNAGGVEYFFGQLPSAYKSNPHYIAPDSSGNFWLAAGLSLSPDTSSISKFTPSGDLDFSYRVTGISSSAFFQSVYVDSQDRAIVGGYKDGLNRIIAFNSSGSIAWQKVWDNSDMQKVIIDPSDNIYHIGSWSNDWLSVKYNSSGTQIWLKRYSSTSSNKDTWHGGQVASSGNLYLAGIPGKGFTTATKFASGTLAKFNSSGNTVWAKNMSAGDRSPFWDCAVDATESYVYVVGMMGASTKSGLTICKVSCSNGSLAWMRRWEINGTATDYGLSSVTVDHSTGLVYALGSYSGTIYLFCFDGAGALSWGKQITTSPYSTYSYPFQVVSDNNGSLYVTAGYSNNGTNFCAVLPGDGSFSGTYGPYTVSSTTFSHVNEYTFSDPNMTVATPSNVLIAGSDTYTSATDSMTTYPI